MRFKSLRTRITVWTITAMLFTPVTVGAVILARRFVMSPHFLAVMLISPLVASLAAALTLLVMLSRKVVRPIREISKATERVAQCDLDVRVMDAGEDEVGELARSFNRMTEDLKRSRNEVEDRRVKCQEAYDSMREAQRKLIQSEKLAAIGTLVAGMAHEINNPVGIIAARAECMLMEAKEKGMDERLTEDLMVINRHAGRIADITRALLTFARQAPAESSEVDLNKIVEDTLFLVAKPFKKEGITVHRRLSPSSPMVMGNFNRIQQALLDILNNARDAVHGQGAITVATGGEGDMAEITVTDTGDGIPEDMLDKIFDPFFTTKEVGRGTGLGLAVSYGIIQDLGGSIEAASRKGEGSTFTIILPALKEG